MTKRKQPPPAAQRATYPEGHFDSVRRAWRQSPVSSALCHYEPIAWSTLTRRAIGRPRGSDEPAGGWDGGFLKMNNSPSQPAPTWMEDK